MRTPASDRRRKSPTTVSGRRWLVIVAVIIATISASSLVGCASNRRVQSDYARDLGVDVAALGSYAWVTPRSLIGFETSPLYLSPFDDPLIRRAVDEVLAEKGYALVEDWLRADFVVVYTAHASQVIELKGMAGSNSVMHGGGAGPVTGFLSPMSRKQVRDFGVFTVQFVEPRSGDLLWMGWGNRVLPRQMPRRELFGRIFSRILAPLPVRS